MRSLDHTRSQARSVRQNLSANGEELFGKLRTLIEEVHKIELVPVDAKGLLQGGRAELVLEEKNLYYDRRLDHSPRELFEVIAHEYGHLELHHDSFSVAQDDLISGSVFLQSGTSRLSRYSPRAAEESEANAFAAELICPAEELFSRWHKDSEITITSLADQYYATESLVRLQLAEGLYQHVSGKAVSLRGNHGPELNDEQETAATFCGAPVLVDAGPGTGKTKTLVRRVVYLIDEKNIPPQQILVLTFSNEAAAELEERIGRVLDSKIASRLKILTFHGFGVTILHSLGQFVGLDVDFSIIDEAGQEEFISELLGSVDCEALLDLKNPEQTAAEVVKQINYLKDRLIGPDQLKAAINDWQPTQKDLAVYLRSEALFRLYKTYEQVSRKKNQVDLADLISLPHQILSVNEEVRVGIRREFPWVLVDEYQDVSRSTALLLQQICSEVSPPWVVGDARQAIYRFRGAAPENVQRFPEDFAGAQVFELSNNYRSAPEIISLLNWLSSSFESPGSAAASPEWHSAADITALNETPVVMAIANSDAAEREGVARVVKSWLEQNVAPKDIAVLARRNVDVRNIAIELKRRGIKAITSGILTAEGAGGDLAAVLTLVDHQQAMSRVVYALAKDRVSHDELNDAIRQLLTADVEKETEWTGSENTRAVANDVLRIYRGLQTHRFTADGWVVLCEFLFFLTPYVRRLLDEDSAESSVQLEETISALSVAARYRVGHRHVPPRKSRIGLAERFRSLVTEAAPGLAPPNPHATAVRVMTCHAAKGLEFSCAAVAGQSLPYFQTGKIYLPPALSPNPEDDLLQADSLLFVGLSRAQRAAVISYAKSASGSARSRARRRPELLIKLQESDKIPVEGWNTELLTDDTREIGRIWGGQPPAQLSLYSLGAKTCMVQTYLEEQLGARFRGRLRPLYPQFTKRVRSMLSQVMKATLENDEPLSEAALAQIVKEEWSEDLDSDHPHISLYKPRAERWAKQFARALERGSFRNGTQLDQTFQLNNEQDNSQSIKLQLVGHFRDDNGDRVVIVLRPNAPTEFSGSVNWSDLKDYQLLPFVLLHERHSDVRPLVFYGEEGSLGDFKWNRRGPEQAIRKEKERAEKVARSLSSGVFKATIDDWTCDRCRSRIICPCWIVPRSSQPLDQ